MNQAQMLCALKQITITARSIVRVQMGRLGVFMDNINKVWCIGVQEKKPSFS